MKWLKRILVAILVLIIVIVGVSFFLPKTYNVERSTSIAAEPATVYGIVNNLKSYNSWMPWNKIDPNMQQTFGPKSAGEGAYYTWTSKMSEVGSGKLAIVESKPTNLVGTSLEFEGMGTSQGGWKLEPEGGGTKITWYMGGRMDDHGFIWGVMGKWMCAVGAMDNMLGKDFDKGLGTLKKLAESPEGKTLAAPGLQNDAAKPMQ